MYNVFYITYKYLLIIYYSLKQISLVQKNKYYHLIKLAPFRYIEVKRCFKSQIATLCRPWCIRNKESRRKSLADATSNCRRNCVGRKSPTSKVFFGVNHFSSRRETDNWGVTTKRNKRLRSVALALTRGKGKSINFVSSVFYRRKTGHTSRTVGAKEFFSNPLWWKHLGVGIARQSHT